MSLRARTSRFGSIETFRSTPLVVFDQGLVSAVNFATTVALVRWLGLELFGEFSLIWMLVLFALGLQQAFLALPMLTIGPKQSDEDRPRYYAALLVLEALFTLVVFGAVWGGCLVASELLGQARFAGVGLQVALLVCVKQAHAFVRSYFFSCDRRGAVLANDAVAYGGQILLLYALHRTGTLNLGSAIWAVVLASGVASVLGLAQVERIATTRADLVSVTRRHWRYSRWLVAKAILQWFSSNYFLLATRALLGPGALGALKAAQTVLGVLHVFFLAMENVVPVRAARLLVTEGLGSMTRYIERLTWIGTAFTLATSLVLLTWPGLLLHLLYGETSPDLETALRGFAILYVFVFEVAVLQLLLRTLERTRPIFTAFAVNAALSILVAYPLVEAFGLRGAIAGMVAQQLLMAGLMFVGLGRVLRDSMAAESLPATRFRAGR